MIQRQQREGLNEILRRLRPVELFPSSNVTGRLADWSSRGCGQVFGVRAAMQRFVPGNQARHVGPCGSSACSGPLVARDVIRPKTLRSNLPEITTGFHRNRRNAVAGHLFPSHRRAAVFKKLTVAVDDFSHPGSGVKPTELREVFAQSNCGFARPLRENWPISVVGPSRVVAARETPGCVVASAPDSR